jgi:hypothetical protein
VLFKSVFELLILSATDSDIASVVGLGCRGSYLHQVVAAWHLLEVVMALAHVLLRLVIYHRGLVNRP